MSGSPRVSIVTPFLDAARFIEEAIESVVAPTYTSWELLLVDDGSSDGSSGDRDALRGWVSIEDSLPVASDARQSWRQRLA